MKNFRIVPAVGVRVGALVGAVAGTVMCGCSNYREGGEGSSAEHGAFAMDSAGTVARFQQRDPSLSKFFDSAYGYVVFPKVTKGGAGIGAASGAGEAFERGALVGTSDMTQVTLGAQLGGQTYSQIVFFQTKGHMDVFKDGNLEFSANASAIAAESGAGAANDFNQGVAVFTMPRGGLMFEASIGGQKFSFTPLDGR